MSKQRGARADKRQKNQRQWAFFAGPKGETRKTSGEGTESLAA